MQLSVNLELTGVVFELRELGDLTSEIALFPDGHYEVISEEDLTYLPAFYLSGSLEPHQTPPFLEEKIFVHTPIIERIYKKVTTLTLPEEKQMKILPITWFLF